MKKMTFILALFLSITTFSQNQVTLTSGIRFNCDIMGLYGNRLTFNEVVSEINSDKVDINSVVSITGKIQKSTLKTIIKKNPKIVLNPDIEATTIESLNTENIIGNAYKPFDQGISFTAGDYITRAGNRYVTGLGLGFGGAILYGVGTTSESTETQVVGGIVALMGGIISITGHFQLIKAGRKMNSDAVTIGPASQGFGLAVNF